MTWAKQLATLEHKSFAELIIKTLKHTVTRIICFRLTNVSGYTQTHTAILLPKGLLSHVQGGK